jgi:hypothetical protein
MTKMVEWVGRGRWWKYWTGVTREVVDMRLVSVVSVYDEKLF